MKAQKMSHIVDDVAVTSDVQTTPISDAEYAALTRSVLSMDKARFGLGEKLREKGIYPQLGLAQLKATNEVLKAEKKATAK